MPITNHVSGLDIKVVRIKVNGPYVMKILSGANCDHKAVNGNYLLFCKPSLVAKCLCTPIQITVHIFTIKIVLNMLYFAQTLQKVHRRGSMFFNVLSNKLQ